MQYDPSPGWYKLRYVSGGVWVPARYWIEDGERETCAECGGTGYVRDQDCVAGCCDCDPDPNHRGTVLMSDQKLHASIGPREVELENGLPPGWPWHPIDEATYEFMLADVKWVRAFAPDDPKANPHQRIDINKIRIEP